MNKHTKKKKVSKITKYTGKKGGLKWNLESDRKLGESERKLGESQRKLEESEKKLEQTLLQLKSTTKSFRKLVEKVNSATPYVHRIKSNSSDEILITTIDICTQTISYSKNDTSEVISDNISDNNALACRSLNEDSSMFSVMTSSRTKFDPKKNDTHAKIKPKIDEYKEKLEKETHWNILDSFYNSNNETYNNDKQEVFRTALERRAINESMPTNKRF